MLEQKLTLEQSQNHYQNKLAIQVGQYSAFLTKFEHLNKRCDKLGFPHFTMNVTHYPAKAPLPNGLYTDHGWMEILVQGNPPILSGYNVVARLERVGDQNMVYAYDDMPDEYRDRFDCDHCKTNHRRVKTYVLWDGSDYFQVGSTCLKDFLSTNPDGALSLYTSMDFMSGPEHLPHGNGDWYYAGEVVALVVHMIDNLERPFVSRGSTFGTTNACTSDHIGQQLWNDKVDKWEVTDENWNKANEVMDFFANLPATDSDYLHNLSVIANATIHSLKQFGLTVSMYPAYLKQLDFQTKTKERTNALAQERSESSHIGSVKDKIESSVTLVHHHAFEGMYGWIDIMKFKDDSGNVLVWFASNSGSLVEGKISDSYGKKFNIKATVKGHDSFKGVKQTKIIRVRTV